MSHQTMKKNFVFLFVFTLLPVILPAQSSYEYESFPDDPLDARIYTLDNGLKVYLSPTDAEPRVQAYVAVRVGSKNDPAETTGLAHYFEHLMFKGTSTFGTIDWEKEEPLLDEIEDLFELYREETDKEKRAEIYAKIDSISYVASTYAIPNEYVRLMTSIGSNGTNAATSNDYTFYVENVPANRLEHWARIQGERFSDPVIRLFHTELETVYEELNMSQTNDRRMTFQALNEALYPNHPYAKQTTLGEPEHLKNPSIINIKQFYEDYYVPNNMAVILAGDFDPDEAIQIVDRYFGHMEPSPVPEFDFPEETPLTEPVVKEVEGLGSEFLQLGWRFNGPSSEQLPYLDLMSNILGNGRAGLVDQNINKPMKAGGVSAKTTTQADYSRLEMFGRPKDGQTMEEVRDLLLEQVELLQSGDWPDWMLEAAKNNIRLNRERRHTRLTNRARDMAMSFLYDVPYEQTVDYLKRLEEITKEEVVEFAREHLSVNAYAVVYKRQVEEMDVELVEKPAITPIHINRNARSDLLIEMQEAEVTPIEPVFLDYERDLVRTYLPNGSEFLYVHDDEEPRFHLAFSWEKGSNHEPMMDHFGRYFSLVGADDMEVEDVGNAFYILASNFSIRVSGNETRITLHGLTENFEQSLELLDRFIWNVHADDKALADHLASEKRSRRNRPTSQQSILSALENYATYGPHNPTTHTMTNEELDEITAQELVDLLHGLFDYEHQVTYTGPHNMQDVIRMLQVYHRASDTLKDTPENFYFEPLDTEEEKVYFAHYDASQSYLQTISKSDVYDPELEPLVNLYNRYFSGGMNAIVFQEMREKRGLAYMAHSNFSGSSRKNGHYTNTSVIATQNDKIIEAFHAFNELFNDMPLTESTFKLAQDRIVSNIRTERFGGGLIIIRYLNDREMGSSVDTRRRIFEETPHLTLDDVKSFNHKFIRNRPKTYIVLGNEKAIDFEALEREFGEVIRLTTDDLFPY